MAGLKQTKNKIIAMKKSQTVTKAMEAVSAAKMRKAQQTALRGRAYARAAATVLSRLSGSRSLAQHPLVAHNRQATKSLYIVLTSDKGLAGALNSAVLRAAHADIQKEKLQPEVLAVGKKANDFFVARGISVLHSLPNNATDAHMMRDIVQLSSSKYQSGEYRFVKIVYQNFVSTFEQRPTLRTVFPLSLRDLELVVSDIVPAKGVFAESAKSGATVATYTLEPSEEEVLGVVLPMLASIIVYHALLEAQASEHSARMVAMKSASDKAGEMQEILTLQFNKARQAAITREVSEIIGGTL
jgi:F-type H+-transporting ATPase subunit gamma